MPRALLPIFLIVLVDILGMTLILPLLPFYAEHFGASPAVVGMLGATFAACQLVSGPVLGQLSDRFGRRRMLLVSQAGTFAGFLLLARAETLWLVFLARVIDGATAGNLSIAQAYITDVTPPHQRARAFGVIGVSFGRGVLLGPAGSGWLAQHDPRWPVYAAAALSATSILATATLLREPATHAAGDEAEAPAAPGGTRIGMLEWSRYAAYLRRPSLGPMLALFLCFALSFSLFSSGFALFAERRFRTAAGLPYGVREVGYVLAYTGFLGIFLQGGLVGRAVKRWGEHPVVGVGFALMSAGYLLLAPAATHRELLVAATVGGVGMSLVRAPLTAMITAVCARDEQGLVLGLTQSMTSLAQIAGPLTAGAIIEDGRLRTWAVAAALPGLLALPIWRSVRGGRVTA